MSENGFVAIEKHNILTPLGGCTGLLEELVKTCDQLFQEGRYTAALTTCERALDTSLSPTERCKILQLKARALAAEDGRWKGPSLHCLREALSLTADSPEEQGQIWATLTAAHASASAVASCRDARNAFVKIQEALDSPLLNRLRPDVEYNVGLALHEVKRYDDAETAYMRAPYATLGSSDPYVLSLKPLIQHNLIDVFQELERFEEVETLMYACYREYGAQIRNRQAVQAIHEGDITSAFLWGEGGWATRPATCGPGQPGFSPKPVSLSLTVIQTRLTTVR